MLSKEIHNWLFGENSQPNFENASTAKTKNNRKELAIYMISEIKGQNELMKKLIKSIPSKVCLMTRNSFFENQVDVQNVPLSSLAALKGAMHSYGCLAMIFEIGNNINCVATDYHGQVMGKSVEPFFF